MRSRVQVILYLAGIFCLAVASYSCGQILWLSSISCGRFFDFFDLLRLSSISCGRGVLAVIRFLRPSGSCIFLLPPPLPISLLPLLVIGFCLNMVGCWFYVCCCACVLGCHVCHCCGRWFADAGCLLSLIFCSAVSAAAGPASVMAGDCCSQKCVLSCCCSCGSCRHFVYAGCLKICCAITVLLPPLCSRCLLQLRSLSSCGGHWLTDVILLVVAVRVAVAAVVIAVILMVAVVVATAVAVFLLHLRLLLHLWWLLLQLF